LLRWVILQSHSTQQLSKALFETLNIIPPDVNNKTKSGHFSTSAAVLEDLRGRHAVVDKLLEYRELFQGWFPLTWMRCPCRSIPAPGRVHTSSTRPVQSPVGWLPLTPKLAEYSHPHRDWSPGAQRFHCSPGTVLLSVDYSQIELRIVARTCPGMKPCLTPSAPGRISMPPRQPAIYDISSGSGKQGTTPACQNHHFG